MAVTIAIWVTSAKGTSRFGLTNSPAGAVREFKRMVRSAILGQNDQKEPSFEWTVRKLIDCRLLGFADGAQAIAVA